MLRLTLVTALAASALAVAGGAPAATTHLLPRVTYEASVQLTPHGPVAMHVVRGPRPVGLYRLEPVLSNGKVIGRETVSSMQRRLSPQSTMVGVNGDFYASKKGRPSGIFMRDGVLVSPPSADRSSAGITLDGLLDVQKVRLSGSWRGLGQRRAINAFNEAPEPNGIALFTPDWGPATPRVPGALAVTLAPFDGAIHERRSLRGGHGFEAQRVGPDRRGHGGARRARDGGASGFRRRLRSARASSSG